MRGSRDAPAKDALGAGPMAAPPATPIASMPAASAPARRREGGRRRPGSDGAAASLTGPAASAVRLLVGELEESVFSAMNGASCGKPHFLHKIPNIDQIYVDMVCSALEVVNFLSTL